MSRQVKKVNISGKEDKSNKVNSWSNTTTDTHYPSEKLVKDSLDGKANSTHNHTKSQITDFPTSMTPTSHTHGNLQNNGQVGSTAQASKNVVTDSSGKITTEDKPTIPSASSTTPSADTTSGSVGTGTTWARSNHTHPKSSIYAEASHTHSQYLTSHQDISGKANTSDLGAVAFSNDYEDLDNKPNIPSGVTVDTTLSSSSNNAIANSTVKSALDNKLDKTHASYKGKNVVTNSSTGAIEFEDKNNHTHSNYLTSTDISGKIDTAGTGLSKSGTTLNHSNSVTALTTASLKKVKYDAQGHITGTSDVGASDLPSHTHDQYLTSHQDITGKENTSNKVTSWSSTTTDTHYPSEKLVKDSLDGKANANHTHIANNITISNDLDNLGTGANSSQESVNQDIDWCIGDLYENKESQSNKVTSWSSTTTDTHYPSEKLVKESIDSVLSNIPTATSELTNDCGFLTSHQDISGKIDTAGTGLSKSGTTLNHSNSVTALTTASFKKVKYDSQGHITGTSDVSASDLPTHTHTVSNITDFPSIPSSSSDLSDGSDLIKKSSTTGLMKNDGSVMTSGTGSTNYSAGNHTHSGYASSSHTHSTWTSQTVATYGTLYVNTAIRMCELRYVRTFGSASANTFYEWHTGVIPSGYRPSSQVGGAINQGGTLYVNASGDIGGIFSRSWSSSANVIGTCMWHY